jgi:serpin B
VANLSKLFLEGFIMFFPRGLAPFLALLLGFTSGCAGNSPDSSRNIDDNALTKAAAVHASNALAWDLFSALAHRESEGANLFFSPASIEWALAMTYTGARGETAAEMARVLHLENPVGGPISSIGPAFGALQANLLDPDKPYTLDLANSLWGQKDFRFQDDFLSGLKTDFRSPLNQVDFHSAPEESRLAINEWVEKKTASKIKNLFPSGTITSSTRLVLANAIYFLGEWENPFKGTSTSDRRFHLTPENSIHVPTMKQTGTFAYGETSGSQVLALPYKGGDLEMVIVLPHDKDGLAGLEAGLDTDLLEGWTSGLEQRKVRVFLPKFSLEGEFSLSQTLAELGMPSAFSRGADFSGMTGNKDLFISQVVHKSFIDVYELGTEAAAATGVGMSLTSMPGPEPELVTFIADHPFLFFIRDKESGLILFLGRVLDPR